jgi:anaerobic selenocysteine-containing dehydrogenase
MALQKFARICPTCEPSCGLVIEADPETGAVGRVSGDPDHPSSQGYVCSKSQAIKALREDPDRLRKPLVREGERRAGKRRWTMPPLGSGAYLPSMVRRQRASILAILLRTWPRCRWLSVRCSASCRR